MSTPPTSAFPQRVASALQDSQLRLALERATDRFTRLRAEALASLPDPDAARDRARQVRVETLRRLDVHLEKFEKQVAAAGGIVHWAADAGEANRIVLEIARRSAARLVVKSKSMVTEEVGLNAALESAGLRVVESDLGEYIIQLAGERPSHIIVPAIHKTKEQVGQLLHEKLGVPLTRDPAEMTRAARAALREVFLNADLGVSGVNFGVAESGAIAIVSNEGNASLTTSTPRVHVALMGIERLVPSLADLAVMLDVLARSATGQKASVYVDLIRGPKRGPDPDGPAELHVVLVDNGRSRVLGGQAAEILLCIRCGACLNACPVYREIGGHAFGCVYVGPVGAVVTPALFGAEGWSELPHASTLCGACREVCPVRIDLPRLLLDQRRETTSHSPPWSRLALRCYRAAVTHPWLFRLSLALARRLTRAGSRDGWRRRLPPPLSGWTAHRDFPAFAPRSFSQEWRSKRRERIP